MDAATDATSRKLHERPDHAAKWRLFDAALIGARALGVDPNEDYKTYVCYEALKRLFYDSGRVGRSAFTVILQDATRSGTSRAPKRSKLNKALRPLEHAAGDVMTELAERRASPVHALGTVVDGTETRGAVEAPLSASLPLAA